MTSTGLPGSQPAGEPRDLVFISYSHAEKIWLERLRIYLKPFTRQNLQVWLDPYIEAGDGWRREISTALSRTCVGVLLVSGNFLASDFICDEELPALLAGVDAGEITLFPVPISASGYKETALARFQFAHPPERPLDGLPKNQRNAALVKIAEQIAAAARKASNLSTPHVNRPGRAAAAPVTPVAPTGRVAILHSIPGQRPNYLSRPEYLNRLKQAVLGSAEQAVAITGAPQGGRVGLHGMGGIGKTVLAIDLVNDEEVRHAFPDGIFWLTLGQTIEPLQLQSDLAGYITSDAKAFATVDEGRDQLHGLLQDKSCLLVLDDLWRYEDARPFDVLGPRSRLLVTTRDADLLVALGARELPLGVLSEEQALELLSSWSGQARSALPPAASEVAETCGYLPLALTLAGARVQGGARWEEVLSALGRGRLEFLDHPYGSVFSSLRFSTDALAEFERERYFELAVFPEDAQVPVEAVFTLWRHTGDLIPDASRDLLLRLHRRALLLRSEDGERISFHDLQHDFLRLNVSSLVETHAALVDAYRAVAGASWVTGPNDGYFFQHLPQHLVAADRLNEYKALLCDYDWLAAKLRATDIEVLLVDYYLGVPDIEKVFGIARRDADLTLIGRALQLSKTAIESDPLLLPSQLLGRLRGVNSPAVKTLLAGADKGPHRKWLCPRFASLTPPGDNPFAADHAVSAGTQSMVPLFFPPRRRATRTITQLRNLHLQMQETLRASVSTTPGLWDGTELRGVHLQIQEALGDLEGPTSSLTAVAVLADSRCALFGFSDNILRLWDLATGDSLCTLEGHSSWVSAVSVLADGRHALSGSLDGTLRLWDLRTGETLRIFKSDNWVTAVAVLADGSRALSGSDDETLRLWDLATGKTLRILRGHRDAVTAVAVLADGSRALSASHDKTLRLWDLAIGTGTTFRPLERLWDLATSKTLRVFEGHRGVVTAVAVLADGSRALSGSSDNTLRLWDLTSGETLRTLEGHTERVTAVAVLSDGRHALSGSYDNTLRLWDLATGDCLAKFTADAVIKCVAFARDDLIVAGSGDGRIHILEIRKPGR